MYERFTPRARKVMQLANQFSVANGIDSVSHLPVFLSIMHEGNSVASHVLESVGIKDREWLLQQAEKRLHRPLARHSSRERLEKLPVDKEFLQRVHRVADCLYSEYVGVEHLLLVSLEWGMVQQILEECQTTTEAVRDALFRLLQMAGGTATRSPDDELRDPSPGQLIQDLQWAIENATEYAALADQPDRQPALLSEPVLATAAAIRQICGSADMPVVVVSTYYLRLILQHLTNETGG